MYTGVNERNSDDAIKQQFSGEASSNYGEAKRFWSQLHATGTLRPMDHYNLAAIEKSLANLSKDPS